MNLSVPTLGIDIAKLKFDVCLIKPSGHAKHKVFQNNRHGFEQLLASLGSHQTGECRACLEATSTYGESLALFLFEAGFAVSVVNPAAVRAFANAGLSRTKTDKVDAELIARFCLAQQPQTWQPPAPALRELQALVRRLESLCEMRVMEENRLSAGGLTIAVERSLEEHIAYLIEEIKQTEKLIRQHINNHPDLKEQSALLDSIPGIGEATAALLLAEMTNIKEYRSARQAAAYAGLVPRERRSGSSLRGTHLFVKNRQCTASQGTLLSGNHGTQMQRVFQILGRASADARQIEDDGHRRGDAKTDSSGLRSSQNRKTV